jgi:hypothetical protein
MKDNIGKSRKKKEERDEKKSISKEGKRREYTNRKPTPSADV